MRSGTLRRWLRFSAVSLAGAAVQTAALALLLRLFGWHYLAASVAAVEIAVLHNFAWHRIWIWADRPAAAGASPWPELVRFHLTNGLLSVAATLGFMRLLVGEANIQPVAANVVALALCGIVSLMNFVLSDRLVFPGRLGRPARGLR